MNDDDQRPVHQLMLGLIAREGVSLIGHSMPSEREALPWQRKLEQHQRARLQPWGTQPPPEKALSYYRFGAQAVVLRRWADAESPGRGDAHALIGPADVLTLPVALGLDRGFDWKSAAASIRATLSGSGLRKAAEADGTIGELRSGAARVSALLRRALGGLIDSLSRPLTIIGCPDEDRVALTWALVHLGNEYLAETSQEPRSWTFSTYETEDADKIPGLPEILFMPGKPVGRDAADRAIVDVRRDDTLSQQAVIWSGELVQRLVSGAPLFAGFDDIPVIDIPAISVTEEAPISSGEPGQPEQEPPLEPSVPGLRPRQTTSGAGPTDWDKPKPVDNVLATQVPAQTPARVPETQKVNIPRLEKDLQELRSAKSGSELESLLRRLVDSPTERVEIRRILSVGGYLEIIILITKLCPQVDEMLELFRRLRIVTFGPAGRDLSSADVVAYAIQLIEHPAAPDAFVHGLVQEIYDRGGRAQVDPVLAARWLAQHDAKEFTRLSRRRHGAGESGVASDRAQRWWLFAAVGIALLLIAVVFVVVLYSIGAGTPGDGSSGPRATTTPPATSPPAVGQQRQEAARPVEVSGSVVANNLVISGPWQATEEKTMAFLLLQSGTDAAYYPRGECRINPQEQSWRCENLQLVVPGKIKPPFTVLVVKIDPKDKVRYEDSATGKIPLEGSPLDPKDVIFRDAGRP